MARILLVDDDRDLLLVASNLLMLPAAKGGGGHSVVTAETVLEALELARKEEFDVVITDVNMTPHNGYELTKSLKQIPGYDVVPVAMLTGRREKRDVERALQAGAQDYIVKPIDPDRLIQKANELAGKAEANRRALRFAEVDVAESAVLETPIKLLAISETGCLLESEHRWCEGAKIRLDAPAFGKIGLVKPLLRVRSSAPSAVEGLYEIRVGFCDLDDRSLQKLRQYLQTRIKTGAA